MLFNPNDNFRREDTNIIINVTGRVECKLMVNKYDPIKVIEDKLMVSIRGYISYGKLLDPEKTFLENECINQDEIEIVITNQAHKAKLPIEHEFLIEMPHHSCVTENCCIIGSL